MPSKRHLAKCGQDIAIQTRSTAKARFGSTTPEQEFTTVLNVKAIVKTPIGRSTFGGVAINQDITHEFCLPFNQNLNLSQEHWILFKNKRYDVERIVNCCELDRSLIMFCSLRGPAGTEAASG